MHPLRRLSGRARTVAGRAVRKLGGATRADVEGIRGELRGPLADSLETLARRVQALETGHSAAAEHISALVDLAAIDAMSRWIRQATLGSRPLVSVILPTCNRPQFLARAIDSVLAQRYENWELMVVDDGGQPESRAVVETLGDDRIRWSGIPKAGACAARNAGLRASAGELIAYLDDDNTMDPDWLYAVAWAFDQRPEVDVLYGAVLIDDILRIAGDNSGALPSTFFHKWSREVLSRANLADIGAIAHRSGLAGAWFDESLTEMADWDLLVRLTAYDDPLRLPVVACYYTTDAPVRLSHGPTHESDHETVLARASSRP